jgi:HlyD family secretion protein
MGSKKNTGTKRRKIVWVLLLVMLLLGGGGVGYFYWNSTTQVATTTQTASYKTAQVQRGNLTISVMGLGSLTASKTVNLSFPVSGKVGKVSVKVGDRVTNGQELALLADISTLQAAVSSAGLTLKTDQQALIDLLDTAEMNLANARLALIDAQKSRDDAKSALIEKGMVRCDEDSIDTYYSEYMFAKRNLELLQAEKGDQNYYLIYILPAKNEVASAYAKYEWCLGYTDYETNSSQADLALADLTLKDAQATLDKLVKNNGIDPDAITQAENVVQNDIIAVQQAQNNLDGASLKAPFNGTIISIAGQEGNDSGTGTFIQIADLYHPQVLFSIDETDISGAKIGYETQVVFDAMPDRIFLGKVVQINPSLTTSSGYQVLQGGIELTLEIIRTSSWQA